MTDAAHRSPVRRMAEWAVIALFLAFLWLPLAGGALRLDRSKPLGEKRELAAKPAWDGSLASLDAWPRQFEAYYNDHFGFRNFLIRQYYIIKVLWLGVSPLSTANQKPAVMAGEPAAAPNLVPRVIVGREGWLFFGLEGIVEDYRGLSPMPAEDLEQWKEGLEVRRLWAEGHGMRHLFLVIPNKHSVYPEYLPRWMTRVGDQTRLDEIAAAINRQTGSRLVDTRQAFRDARHLGQLYQKTGTHYNNLGAFVAYRTLLTAMRDWQPELRPLALEAFDISRSPGPAKDLALMLGMEDMLEDMEVTMTPREPQPIRQVPPALDIEMRWPPFALENPRARGGRVLVLHDSFGPALGPFLALHFERVVFYPTANFTPEIINAEQPDIIITEMVERTVANYVPYNFPEVERFAAEEAQRRR